MLRALASRALPRTPLWARAFATYPPHTVVGLPALSPTMTTGNIAKWVKKEGELVRPGEMIAQVRCCPFGILCVGVCMRLRAGLGTEKVCRCGGVVSLWRLPPTGAERCAVPAWNVRHVLCSIRG